MVHSGCVVFKFHVSHGLQLYDKLYIGEGGRQHRTTPAGQIFGGVATPATPAVLYSTIQYNTKFVKRHVAVLSESLDAYG